MELGISEGRSSEAVDHLTGDAIGISLDVLFVLARGIEKIHEHLATFEVLIRLES